MSLEMNSTFINRLAHFTQLFENTVSTETTFLPDSHILQFLIKNIDQIFEHGFDNNNCNTPYNDSGRCIGGGYSLQFGGNSHGAAVPTTTNKHYLKRFSEYLNLDSLNFVKQNDIANDLPQAAILWILIEIHQRGVSKIMKLIFDNDHLRSYYKENSLLKESFRRLYDIVTKIENIDFNIESEFINSFHEMHPNKTARQQFLYEYKEKSELSLDFPDLKSDEGSFDHGSKLSDSTAIGNSGLGGVSSAGGSTHKTPEKPEDNNTSPSGHLLTGSSNIKSSTSGKHKRCKTEMVVDVGTVGLGVMSHHKRENSQDGISQLQIMKAQQLSVDEIKDNMQRFRKVLEHRTQTKSLTALLPPPKNQHHLLHFGNRKPISESPRIVNTKLNFSTILDSNRYEIYNKEGGGAQTTRTEYDNEFCLTTNLFTNNRDMSFMVDEEDTGVSDIESACKINRSSNRMNTAEVKSTFFHGSQLSTQKKDYPAADFNRNNMRQLSTGWFYKTGSSSPISAVKENATPTRRSPKQSTLTMSSSNSSYSYYLKTPAAKLLESSLLLTPGEGRKLRNSEELYLERFKNTDIYDYRSQPERLTKLEDQNYKCRSCMGGITKWNWLLKQNSYCHYTGYWYCGNCISKEKRMIPWNVLEKWDFKTYSVSKEAQEELDSLYNKNILVIDLTSDIVKKNANLYEALVLKRQLHLIFDYICQISFIHDLMDFNGNLLLKINLFSLKDLQEIYTGALTKHMRNWYQILSKHIMSNCNTCMAKGKHCTICNDHNSKLYPFDIKNTSFCSKCKRFYHTKCLQIQGCTSCIH
jgi:hypothetical protein